jgi:hypothetical protein
MSLLRCFIIVKPCAQEQEIREGSQKVVLFTHFDASCFEDALQTLVTCDMLAIHETAFASNLPDSRDNFMAWELWCSEGHK